jgi:hypothetical protein
MQESHKAKTASLSRYGSYIQEGNIYIPNEKGIVLVRNSPVLVSPKEATQAHRNGKEFHIDAELAHSYLDKAKSNSDEAFLLKDRKSIPTNRFSENELTLWLFQDQAQDFGDFLANTGINKMPLWFSSQDYFNDQEAPYANQLWLCDLDFRSGLGGNVRYLICDGRLRGVSEKTGEASSQKTLAYTPKQISSALKALKISGLEEQILGKLKEEQ